MTLATEGTWPGLGLPERLPNTIIDKADSLPAKVAFLTGRLAPVTATRLAELLLVTNSYCSNLIERQRSEPVALQEALKAAKRDRAHAQDLAVKHMEVQRLFERALRRKRHDFRILFSPELISAVHMRLFNGTDENSCLLPNGRVLIPGQLRSGPDDEVIVGAHAAPRATSVMSILEHLQKVYVGTEDPRRRLVAALAYHHRLAWLHPFLDGNGRVARMVTHLQLNEIGLQTQLWSLSRGLAHRRDEYYRVLAMADRLREGGCAGRGQMSQKHFFAFIEFMLDVCHGQVDYMTEALNRDRLRERLIRSFRTNENLLAAGIREESAPAVLALLLQGALPRSEFKTFTGLTSRPAIDELSRLVKAGIVVSPTPKSRMVEPGLPSWFAQDIFPELHLRF